VCIIWNSSPGGFSSSKPNIIQGQALNCCYSVQTSIAMSESTQTSELATPAQEDPSASSSKEEVSVIVQWCFALCVLQVRVSWLQHLRR